MWKYTGKEQINEYLLSLGLLNCNKDKYIRVLYTISNNVENYYKIHKIKKNNGKLRTIYEPSATLKHIQRVILESILNERPISEYACAYHKGLSLKDNALPHVGKRVVLKLDIEDFFDNIDFIDVYKKCFPEYLFPKSAGMILTYLCTYDEHIPQGAPTSAYISNLVMRDFDELIGKWCCERDISYTRYSDDMTFSGDFNPSNVIKIVALELKNLGLRLNHKKTHVVKQSSNQLVTGIVVNEKTQVSRAYRDKIRQEIYYIQKFGIDSHMKHIGSALDKVSYLRSLYGKILFVLQINKDDKEFIEYKHILKSLL